MLTPEAWPWPKRPTRWLSSNATWICGALPLSHILQCEHHFHSTLNADTLRWLMMPVHSAQFHLLLDWYGLQDDVLADKIDASVQYGVHLYEIIHAAWRVMAQGAAYSP